LSTEEAKSAAKAALLMLPRGMLAAASLFSSLPTLAAVALLSLETRPTPETVVAIARLFLFLYLVQLPLTLYTARWLTLVSQRLRCDGERRAPRSFEAVLASLVPLGFIIPLTLLGRGLSECGFVKGQQRLGANGLDILLNFMTLGLHALLYALLLEKIVDAAVEEDYAGSS
jgi:hypothetical protein